MKLIFYLIRRTILTPEFVDVLVFSVHGVYRFQFLTLSLLNFLKNTVFTVKSVFLAVMTLNWR